MKTSTESLHNKLASVSHHMTANGLIGNANSKKIDHLLFGQTTNQKIMETLQEELARANDIQFTLLRTAKAILSAVSPRGSAEKVDLEEIKAECDRTLDLWNEPIEDHRDEMLSFRAYNPEREAQEAAMMDEFRRSFDINAIPPIVADVRNWSPTKKLNSRFAPSGVLQHSMDLDPCDKMLQFGPKWWEKMKPSSKKKKWAISMPHCSNDRNLLHHLKEAIVEDQRLRSKKDDDEAGPSRSKKDSKTKPKKSKKKVLETIEESEEEMSPDGPPAEETSPDGPPATGAVTAAGDEEIANDEVIDEVNAEVGDDQGLDSSSDIDDNAPNTTTVSSAGSGIAITTPESTPTATPARAPAEPLAKPPLKPAAKTNIPPRLSTKKKRHPSAVAGKEIPVEKPKKSHDRSESRGKSSEHRDRDDSQRKKKGERREDRRDDRRDGHRSRHEADRRDHSNNESKSSSSKPSNSKSTDREKERSEKRKERERGASSSSNGSASKPKAKKHRSEERRESSSTPRPSASTSHSFDRQLDAAIASSNNSKKRPRTPTEEKSAAKRSREELDCQEARAHDKSKKVVSTEVQLEELSPDVRPHLEQLKANKRYGSSNVRPSSSTRLSSPTARPRAQYPTVPPDKYVTIKDLFADTKKSIAANKDIRTPVAIEKKFVRGDDDAPQEVGLYEVSTLEKTPPDDPHDSDAEEIPDSSGDEKDGDHATPKHLETTITVSSSTESVVVLPQEAQVSEEPECNEEAAPDRLVIDTDNQDGQEEEDSDQADQAEYVGEGDDEEEVERDPLDA